MCGDPDVILCAGGPGHRLARGPLPAVPRAPAPAAPPAAPIPAGAPGAPPGSGRGVRPGPTADRPGNVRAGTPARRPNADPGR